MTVLRWMVYTLLVAVLVLVLAGQLGWLSGREPGEIGVRDGKLNPPSRTENSVSSQAKLHNGHAMQAYADIAPLALNGDGPQTMARLKRLLQAMPGVTIVKDDGQGYLYAQCTTRWLKFVDDLELWLDPANQVVQVRSASRLGRKDFGVNRQRVEALRAALAQAS